MTKIYKLALFVCLLLAGQFSAQAQNRFFREVSESQIAQTGLNRVIVPQKYRAFEANLNELTRFLWSLPSEQNLGNRSQAPVMEIPMPDGQMGRFRVWESSIQEPALQARFPEIRTFAGQGIDDPYATIRFDMTPRGFHAQVLTINGNFYVDPYQLGNTNGYISYFRKDLVKPNQFTCEVPEVNIPSQARIAAACRGTELKTYRLAVACTGEYAQAPGIAAGTNAAILHAAIVTTVNRVVGVYEKEIAVRLVLIANNNIIEFLNAATDPFSGNNNANVLINESQTVIDANIGSANYDFGHTFSTGGGGLAQLASVCGGSKARGITGSPQPTGDAYDIDYVAHEMGHQLGGNHSMAGCGSSPTNTKYEVGSGTTIMAYAGICGAQNIQPNSDPYFHSISFDEISNFLSGSGNNCGFNTPTGNNLPVINALPNNAVSIPPSTPFTLTGSATDPDGDPLTYSWEQWDFSGTANWNAGATAGANNTVPLFKARVPKTDGVRTFPDIAVILAGYPANPAATMGGLKGETLSPVARNMKFRLTVRDNRAGGGGLVSSGSGCQGTSEFVVTVVGTTPFTVAAPNGGENWTGGTTQTVTWNVANTNAAPVNTAQVKISLSTDGGLTYPIVVLNATDNDGTETITVPGLPATTGTCRIKVEAINNIFFDISNANFTIQVPPSGFTFSATAATNIACGTASANATLGTNTSGGFSTPINLSATGNPAGTTVSFSPNPLTPGNSTTVTLNNANTLAPGSYTINVSGVAGASTQSTDITFVVQPGTPPAITAQPAGVTVCEGSAASFSVTASGSGLSYQWQSSTDGGTTWNNISGATAPVYDITSTTAAQNNIRYRVVISTICASSISDAAVLTVNGAPAISTQPADAAVCTGNNITFSVGATGAGLTYQWQESTDGGATWNNITGANANAYTINNVTTASNNYQYRVNISGSCPSPVTSNAATLTVGTSVAISLQPASQVVCSGSNAVFSALGSGSGVNYQWQVSTDGGATWTDITGATTDTYTITAATEALNGYRYRAVLTNATCTTPTFSDAALLTVNSLPAVTTQPSSVTLCSGSNHTFTAAGTGTGINYQWQVSTDGGATFTDIPGETNANLSLTNIAASANNNQYHLVIGGVCTPDAISNNVTLTVISPVTVTAQPASTAVCVGSNTSFTAAGSGTGVIYQWQVSTDGGATWTDISGATSATLSINNAQTSDNGNRYRVLMSNATCTTPATSDAALLTVNALPNVTANAAQTNVCTGTAVQLTASGAVNYNWTPGNLSGDVVTVNPTVDPNNPGQPLVNTYTVTGTDANGCVSTANISVTADPLPVVTLTATPPQTRVHPGITVLLRATVTPAANYAFAWRKNGVLINNSTDSLRVGVADMGDYTVTANVIGATCENISDVVSVRDSASTTLFIFPNPNNGQFTVSYHNPGGVRYDNPDGLIKSRTLTVYDAKGARVYSRRLTAAETYELIRVNLTPASAGTYFVELRDASGERLASGKVLVQY